jgi:hypothetical protein
LSILFIDLFEKIVLPEFQVLKKRLLMKKLSGHEVLAFFEGQKLTPSGAISSSFGKQEYAGTRGFGLFLRLHDVSTHNISSHNHQNPCKVIKKI